MLSMQVYPASQINNNVLLWDNPAYKTCNECKAVCQYYAIINKSEDVFFIYIKSPLLVHIWHALF